ncbi:histidinol dehydrogenase [uncultured Rubinisphaera sp.]|uniref:histidinol dehydrogenase n=1 Tax=uncultured Rubinisphaera sp. TaxID=1678686 RepID=UPI0030D78AAA
MTILHIKKALKSFSGISAEVTERVEELLKEISAGREEAVRDLAAKFDGWEHDFIIEADKLDALADSVNPQIKRDIEFAHQQVSSFAKAQLASINEFEIEVHPGVKLGQRLVPSRCAGCYIPGGRFAHAASAIMSVATAKAAGVDKIIACTPPRGEAIDATVAFALRLSGADVVMSLGGVQAIATLAYGLFTGTEADIVVGPGNAYVAEAKRLLFGKIGIDVVAGPTESLIVADKTADPFFVAVDLVSQAEHGFESAVWLVTDDERLANKVLALVPQIIQDLPQPEVAEASWRDFGEIVLCENRDEMLEVADQYACEHTHVMVEDLDWWRMNLRNYGSLFLGEECTVAFGDKTSGTNHILPTERAARYSGGLNVMKFVKVLTWQQLNRSASQKIASVTSRISRNEGMEAHARAADLRLLSYFPETNYEFDVYQHPQPKVGTE